MKNQQKQEIGNKQIKGKLRLKLKSSPKVGSKRARKQSRLYLSFKIEELLQ